jgi:hypothetical protein
MVIAVYCNTRLAIYPTVLDSAKSQSSIQPILRHDAFVAHRTTLDLVSRGAPEDSDVLAELHPGRLARASQHKAKTGIA